MIEAVRILIYLRPTQLKRGPTQNENLVQVKCTPKHSAICFQFLQKWIQNTTSRDMNYFFQRPEFLLLSPRAEKSTEVFREQKLGIFPFLSFLCKRYVFHQLQGNTILCQRHQKGNVDKSSYFHRRYVLKHNQNIFQIVSCIVCSLGKP